MSNFKKNIILTSVNKQNKDIKGVFTIERNSNGCAGILRIYNLNANGNYCLGILVNGVPLQKTALSSEVVFCKVELPDNIELTSKIAVVVIETSGSNNKPIVFGTTENGGWNENYNFFAQEDLSKQIEDEIKKQIPELEEISMPIEENIGITLNNQLNKNIGDNTCDNCIYKQSFYENANMDNQTCECEHHNECQFENQEQNMQIKKEDKSFFEIISPKIEELFETNQPCEELNSLVASSRWVKVVVDESEKYYIGVIYENSQPKYIAYAVDGVYSKTPPKELEPNAQWLPLNSLFPESQGYWLMFQNALTGE